MTPFVNDGSRRIDMVANGTIRTVPRASGVWLLLICLAFTAAGADWPQFPGVNHDGISTARVITNWTGSVTNPLWRILLANALCSGTPLTSNRVVAMEVLAATNPAQTLSESAELTNGLALTNGRVRVENIDSSGHPRRYFIVREPN